jgi:succinoglycan biosynthesis transport protein ExoP
MDSQSRNTSSDTREQLLAYWRHRRTFWVVAGSLLAAALLIAMLWPPTYRATAVILIEQQEIPQELVRSVITSYADQRVQVISQRVMTSQNLMALIDRYKLYPDKRERVPREELLETMRDDITMKMISAAVIDPRSGQPTHATIAFSVSYDSRSPDLALKVANDLSSLYLNENLASRAQRSKQTASFFTEEASRQQQRIAELDERLAQFKEKHQDELPEFVQQNSGLADRTELQLHEVQDHIGAMDAQIVLLKAQLTQINPTAQVYSETGQHVFGAEDQLKNLKAKLAGLKGRYGASHPDVLSTQREIQGLEKEVDSTSGGNAHLERKLTETRAQLAAATQKYSVEHPDVVRLRREVDTLEAELRAAPKDAAADTNKARPDNPAYIQVTSELDALTVGRESEIKKVEELKVKLDGLTRRMSHSPEVERQYREIARDLEAAQYKYGEILSKQSEAQIAVNLETEQKGEKFTMIEAPQPPEKPVSPNRILILAIGLVLALGGGVSAVLGREALDASVRGPKDVRELLQVPPIAAIPVMVTQGERTRRRRIMRYSWGGGLAAVALAALTVHFFLVPLDVLWLALVRRWGV